ncbi:MAG: NGG1p interacting factor NIF3 [Fibrobacterota bacterium]
MYKLIVFIPAEYRDSVKDALFAAGAGTQGNYSRCSWESFGTGQFLPGQTSTPFLGTRGTVERVEEYRVEMLVAPAKVSAVIAALKEAHPYEEPAFEFLSVLTEQDFTGADQDQ